MKTVKAPSPDTAETQRIASLLFSWKQILERLYCFKKQMFPFSTAATVLVFIFYYLTLTPTPCLSQPPNYLWAKNIGSTGTDYGQSIAVDDSGNSYITGYFNGTADFNPDTGTANLTSFGLDDIFFAKYDANGNYLWAKSIGGSGYDRGTNILVDGSGNILVTGFFYVTVDFDPDTGNASLASVGYSDIFFAKYDANGNYLWAKSIGSTADDWSNSIAVNRSGNVYITGAFNDTADFDPGAGTANLISMGFFNIFFAKYDANGNYLWAKSIGSTSNGYGNSITVDPSSPDGNIYITGNFYGTADFDPGTATVNLMSVGLYDIFLAKYDANGNYLWAKGVGSTGDDIGYGIAMDNSRNSYITGYFYNTADFDPDTGTSNLTSVGSEDIFFAKYDTNGNYLWAKSVGSTGSDISYSIAVNPYLPGGNFYITGYFGGTSDFDPGADTVNLTSAGLSDIFFAKYDANGNYLWAKSIGGADYDIGYGIAADRDSLGGNTYITGLLQSTADFDPGAGTANLIPVGFYDIFLARYDNCGVSSVSKTDVSCNGGNNGTATVAISNGTVPYAYKWNTGATTQSISGITAGTYVVTTTDAAGCMLISTETITQPNELIVYTGKQDITCYGANDGSASVSATGGIEPYIHPHPWSNGDTAHNIMGLTPGTYFITITDANGCQASNSAVINEPPLLQMVLNMVHSSCTASDGSISASVSGGKGTYSYLWSNSQTAAVVTSLDTGLYWVMVYDSNGCNVIDSATIYCDLVWPGDINVDYKSNHYDLFGIGLYYGETGPPRDVIHQNIVWKGHPATFWSGVQKNGKNKKHVDCNGDGTVNNQDVLGIINNFGMTHAKTAVFNTYNPANPDLYFEVLTPNVAPGVDVEVKIMAGKDSISLYGVGFDILLDTFLIEDNSVSLAWNNSWIGTENVDMLTFDTAMYSTGLVFAACVRTDQTTKIDSGEIAHLKFRIRSDAVITDSAELNISISSEQGIKDATGDTMTFNSDKDTLIIKPVGTKEIYSGTKEFKLYPNPTGTLFHFELPHSSNVYTVSVINFTGEKVYEKSEKEGGRKTINMEEFSPGIYLISITDKDVVYRQTLQVVR